MKNSIFSKIVLILSILIVVILSVLLFYSTNTINILRSENENQNTLYSQLAIYSLSNSFEGNNDYGHIFQPLELNKGINYFYLVGKSYDVLYSKDRSKVGSFLSDSETISRMTSTLSSREIDPETIEVISPVYINGIAQQYLVIGFSSKSIQKGITNQYVLLLALIVICIVISLIVIMLLSRSINKPLQGLMQGVKELGEGNFDYHIEVSSEDEIGKLALQFNKMVKLLAESRAKLQKYSLDLEKQVKKRTNELITKNDELERFNKLAIGRELKMVELKNKVKELENKS